MLIGKDLEKHRRHLIDLCSERRATRKKGDCVEETTVGVWLGERLEVAGKIEEAAPVCETQL